MLVPATAVKFRLAHFAFKVPRALTVHQDVGVAGWATGGGHGVLTGAYGMGTMLVPATAVKFRLASWSRSSPS
jgi:hypothetical protein